MLEGAQAAYVSIHGLELHQCRGRKREACIHSSDLWRLPGGATGDQCFEIVMAKTCLLYTSPSPRDGLLSRMPSSA